MDLGDASAKDASSVCRGQRLGVHDGWYHLSRGGGCRGCQGIIASVVVGGVVGGGVAFGCCRRRERTARKRASRARNDHAEPLLFLT